MADAGASADPFSSAALILNVQRTGGWRFKPNAPLELTHLGLFDHQADGFQMAYPVGIWDTAGTLLASATVPAGTAAALEDGFRYTAIQSLGSIVLSPGETYTLGYWASSIAPSDRVITQSGVVALSPWITQIGNGFTAGQAPQLTMPTNPITDQGFGAEWFGRSFKFNVVPGPGGALMLIVSGVLITSRRQRH